jgi:putative membrane protein
LIKAGVKPDLRKSGDEGDSGTKLMKRAEAGLGRMVELGLPLIMYVNLVWIV